MRCRSLFFLLIVLAIGCTANADLGKIKDIFSKLGEKVKNALESRGGDTGKKAAAKPSSAADKVKETVKAAEKAAAGEAQQIHEEGMKEAEEVAHGEESAEEL